METRKKKSLVVLGTCFNKRRKRVATDIKGKKENRGNKVLAENCWGSH